MSRLFPDRNVQHTFVDSAQTAEKGDDIGFSCCQRGKAERKNVQAEKEVFAKTFFVYHFSQVTVCGGEDTDINADDAASADPDNLLLLENAQKPGLERVRHIANLIQKDSALIRLLKEAHAAPALCTGKGAFLVTEKLAFQQAFGERGAVDGYKGFIFPRGVIMDGRANSSLPVPVSR